MSVQTTDTDVFRVFIAMMQCSVASFDSQHLKECDVIAPMREQYRRITDVRITDVIDNAIDRLVESGWAQKTSEEYVYQLSPDVDVALWLELVSTDFDGALDRFMDNQVGHDVSVEEELPLSEELTLDEEQGDYSELDDNDGTTQTSKEGMLEQAEVIHHADDDAVDQSIADTSSDGEYLLDDDDDVQNDDFPEAIVDDAPLLTDADDESDSVEVNKVDLTSALPDVTAKADETVPHKPKSKRRSSFGDPSSIGFDPKAQVLDMSDVENISVEAEISSEHDESEQGVVNKGFVSRRPHNQPPTPAPQQQLTTGTLPNQINRQYGLKKSNTSPDEDKQFKRGGGADTQKQQPPRYPPRRPKQDGNDGQFMSPGGRKLTGKKKSYHLQGPRSNKNTDRSTTDESDQYEVSDTPQADHHRVEIKMPNGVIKRLDIPDHYFKQLLYENDGDIAAVYRKLSQQDDD